MDSVYTSLPNTNQSEPKLEPSQRRPIKFIYQQVIIKIKFPLYFVPRAQISTFPYRGLCCLLFPPVITSSYLSYLFLLGAIPPPDKCTQHFSTCTLELWQRLDQPALQLEQPGQGTVSQASEASVRGATLAAVRRRWLELRGWRRRGRRRRWADGGR